MNDFMEMAMERARYTHDHGNFPVGAALTVGEGIEETLIGLGANQINTARDFTKHAENMAIFSAGPLLYRALSEGKKITLRTTLEPCIGCFSQAVMTRVSEVIYACPDPMGGATLIKPPTQWYERHWPKITQGPYLEQSRDLLIEHCLQNPERWQKLLDGLRQIK